MVAAKSVKSLFWFVRVDAPEEFLRQKCKILAECIDVRRMLAVYHVGEKKDNPHCHFIIELLKEVQKQSFALRIKGLFGVVRSGQYACEPWDGRTGAGAMSYLYHEDNEAQIVNKGFTDEEITEAKIANESVQRVLAVNKERASNKFVDKAMAHFTDSSPDTRTLLEYFIKLVKAGEIYWPGEYRAKQLIQEVWIKMAASEEYVVGELYNKMFI